MRETMYDSDSESARKHYEQLTERIIFFAVARYDPRLCGLFETLRGCRAMIV